MKVISMNKRILDILEEIQQAHISALDEQGNEQGESQWDLYDNLSNAYQGTKQDRVCWLKANRKRPMAAGEGADWFVGTDEDPQDPQSNLPEVEFNRLKLGTKYQTYQEYETFQEAVLDFIES